MWVIAVSLLLGAVGVAASAAVFRRLAGHPRELHVYWGVGVVALLPAWLVALLPLLGATPGGRHSAVALAFWVFSAASAVLGVIVTEAQCRDRVERETELPSQWVWRRGVLALVPAWLVALLGYVVH